MQEFLNYTVRNMFPEHLLTKYGSFVLCLCLFGCGLLVVVVSGPLSVDFNVRERPLLLTCLCLLVCLSIYGAKLRINSFIAPGLAPLEI